MDWLFPVDQVANWLNSFGIGAVLISLLLNIFISVLGVLPSLFLSGANAVVFGIIPGFFISLTGEVLGAGLSFWLYRWGFGKLKYVNQKNWAWLQKINGASRKRRMVILLLARLTPLVPSGVITFAAAVSSMRFLDFIWISLAGKAPSIAIETLVGHDLIQINDNLPRLVTSLLFMVLIYVLYKKINKKSNG
ncbi:MAG TPA: VTT domain-containing protein [Bacilli bacterium]